MIVLFDLNTPAVSLPLVTALPRCMLNAHSSVCLRWKAEKAVYITALDTGWSIMAALYYRFCSGRPVSSIYRARWKRRNKVLISHFECLLNSPLALQSDRLKNRFTAHPNTAQRYRAYNCSAYMYTPCCIPAPMPAQPARQCSASAAARKATPLAINTMCSAKRQLQIASQACNGGDLSGN